MVTYPKVRNRFERQLDAILSGPAARWQAHFKGKPLANLLEEFRAFAYAYFDHVIDTYPGDSAPSLSHDLHRALRTLQEEWAVICRACEQREIVEFEGFLSKADAYAQNYYARFLGAKASHAEPITYFEKLYAITRYAFTPYPLVSIPLYFFNDPRQWLSLAHEMGTSSSGTQPGLR